MAQIIPFPTGLVAAANFAAKASAPEKPAAPPARDGANVIPLPHCQSVATLEEQLQRMKERLATEIGSARFSTPPHRTIDGHRDRGGNHWTAR